MSFTNVGPSVPPKGAGTSSGGDVAVTLQVEWLPLLRALRSLEEGAASHTELLAEKLMQIADAIARIDPTVNVEPKIYVEPTPISVSPQFNVPQAPQGQPPHLTVTPSPVPVEARPGETSVSAELHLPKWALPVLTAGLVVFGVQLVVMSWIAFMVFHDAKWSKVFF